MSPIPSRLWRVDSATSGSGTNWCRNARGVGLERTRRVIITTLASTLLVIGAAAIRVTAAETPASASTAEQSVPGVPADVSALPMNGGAFVTFTAPADNGGSAISSYTVTAYSGESVVSTATGEASPVTLTGLVNGTAYTVRVSATNGSGAGAESAEATVTPRGDEASSYGAASGSNRIMGTATDPSGNVYVIGTFNTTFTFAGVTLTKIGTKDSFVAKFDQTGTRIWSTVFGGTGAAITLYGLAVNSSGEVHVVGEFSGATLSSPASLARGNTSTSTATTGVVWKLNSAGASAWNSRIAGTTSGATTTLRSVSVGSDGTVLAGGYTNVSLTTGNPASIVKQGSVDAFVFRYNASGTYQGYYDFYGSSTVSAYVNSLVVHSDNVGFTAVLDVQSSSGGITTFGSGTSGSTGATFTSYAVSKIGTRDSVLVSVTGRPGATAAVAAHLRMGGSGATTTSRAVVLSSSGEAFVLADFTGGNLTTPALARQGAQSIDTIVARSNAAMSEWSWRTGFGGTNAIIGPRALALDAAGVLHVGGEMRTGAMTSPALSRIGQRDIWLATLTGATGTVESSRGYGGEGAEAYL